MCTVKTYRVSPNTIFKLGGEVKNILRNHSYIGKYGWKAIGGAVRELARSASVVSSFRTLITCDEHESLYERRVGEYPLPPRPRQRKWTCSVRLYEEICPTRRHQTLAWVHQNLEKHGFFKACQL
ncbi:hypothetical protein TNCV_1029181 [Trichonephila clavipes]|nr:hypothetical protein TNCV_1029181 [Trichonephila clavipes]